LTARLKVGAVSDLNLPKGMARPTDWIEFLGVEKGDTGRLWVHVSFLGSNQWRGQEMMRPDSAFVRLVCQTVPPALVDACTQPQGCAMRFCLVKREYHDGWPLFDLYGWLERVYRADGLQPVLAYWPRLRWYHRFRPNKCRRQWVVQPDGAGNWATPRDERPFDDMWCRIDRL
jgi:hypothetical protein